ncbi:MAG TPA: EAL domain-containing protein [Solirubrobacteraceae bacterium]
MLYQPVVELTSGFIIGAEALVRWRHPERGVIAPDQFIPVAERRGLITAVGTFVLDDACRQLAAWTHTDGFPESFKIGVSFSGRELRDPDLVARTAATLQRHHIAAEQLVIEITENVLIGELGDAHHAIESVAALGVRA